MLGQVLNNGSTAMANKAVTVFMELTFYRA